MPALLNYITDCICSQDPKYAPTLQSHLNAMDDRFRERAEWFFGRYQRFITGQGRTIDFGIDCFQKLRASVQEERFNFLRTGRYASQSFEDVNQRVYGNPEIMESYMHGLVFAQFLWPEQYRRFCFFSDNLPAYQEAVRSYLEIGGGHGLYAVEALRLFDESTTFDLVDISSSSLALARGMATEPRIQYHLMNIFEFPEDRRYDFITMGEVLEHLERPQELLAKARALMSHTGRMYVTTPANAPMVDHIYLFHDADEIRAMLEQCGFVIECEVTQYAADLPPRRRAALKTALMFGAFVKRA